MAYSKLVSKVIASPNHYNGRGGYKLCKFTPHHAAFICSAETLANVFVPRSRGASANYCIGNDGKIIGVVDENNGPWTSNSYSNDCQAVTVEVSNCEVGGEWKVSDAAWNSLVQLAVDVCKRNNFRLYYDGTPKGSLTTHNMFAPTACPGPYLRSRMPELARTVNSILDGKKPTPEPLPQPDYTGIITYQAYDGKWEEEVNKCDDTADGYAGDSTHFISGVRAKPQFGEIKTKSHILNGDWLDEISSKDYVANDTLNGNTYSGIYNTPLDAIMFTTTKGYIDARVKTSRGWLPWVRFYKTFNEKIYVGNFGEPIIGLQMK